MDEPHSLDAQMRPAGPASSSPTRTLWTVQVLRGIAALMVVVGHSQSATAIVVGANGGHFMRSTLVPWGAGVDLFFVISGFIMVHTSARLFGRPGAWSTFLRRRLIRIVPLYWLVTTLFLALLAVATAKGGDPFPTVRVIVASYAFLPAATGDGGPLFPVFDLGWTLNYEMFFYALFALVIGWPRRRALAAIGIAIAVLVAVGPLVPGPSAAWFWTRPIMVDFALGLAVGALVGRGIVVPPALRIVAGAVAALFLLGDPAHLFAGPVGTTVANGWPRVLLAGVPVAVILAAALLGPEPGMPRAVRPLTHVGDASYSLYLFHPFALIGMEKIAQKLPVVASLSGWPIVAATVAAALVIAFAAYRWIERPMTVALGRWIVPRRPTTRPAFAAD